MGSVGAENVKVWCPCFVRAYSWFSPPATLGVCWFLFPLKFPVGKLRRPGVFAGGWFPPAPLWRRERTDRGGSPSLGGVPKHDIGDPMEIYGKHHIFIISVNLQIHSNRPTDRLINIDRYSGKHFRNVSVKRWSKNLPCWRKMSEWVVSVGLVLQIGSKKLHPRKTDMSPEKIVMGRRYFPFEMTPSKRGTFVGFRGRKKWSISVDVLDGGPSLTHATSWSSWQEVSFHS